MEEIQAYYTYRVEEWLLGLIRSYKEREFIPPFNEADFNVVVEKYTDPLIEYMNENFAGFLFTDNLVPYALTIAFNSLFKRFAEQYSGIVFAGFGGKELRPSAVTVRVERMINGKLKYQKKPQERGRIEVDNLGYIIGLAQKDMVMSFMTGIHEIMEESLLTHLEENLEQLPGILVERLQDHFKADTNFDEVGEMIRDDLLQLYRNFHEKIYASKLENFIQPTMDIVGALPTNELAEMAEMLVNMTSFKRKISESLETVSDPIDVAIIRGTTADENGNITMEEEAVKLEALSVAQAAKSNGGKVLVQVKNMAKNGSLPPKDVVIPGIYVDGIVIAENAEEDHRQTSSYFYHPVYTGELRVPLSASEPLPLTVRKIIGRRAVKELYPGAVVNLGTGIPGDVIGPITDEEGINNGITLTVESGVIGGVPEGGLDFGIGKNAEAIIEHGYQFDYYNGSGVDITFMGLAEADSEGNVNVSKFGPKTAGCGGFIDITQPAKKVVFCTTFTAGGLEISVTNGELNVTKEGKIKKFVSDVNQITFSGKNARNNKQPVILVTERAVFELTLDGWMLTEIAPGIDLEKDVLQYMDFKPLVSDHLKTMDAEIFRDEPMNLRNRFFSRAVV